MRKKGVGSLREAREDQKGLKFVNFIRTGEKSGGGFVEGSGLLGTAGCW
jgi:hypothetical protein